MRVLHLIKKDILLAGNYFWLSLIILIAFPVFLNNQSAPFSSVYILIMSVSFSCYFLFNNIFLMEDKYMGNLYMLAIPYPRTLIVIAKYILSVLMFILTVICYLILSRISINNIILIKDTLTFSAISIVFFAMSVVLGIFFPIYFRYSYIKIKFALLIVMILLPTWGFVAIAHLLGNNFVESTPKLGINVSLLFIVFGIMILFASSRLSTRFLKRRDF